MANKSDYNKSDLKETYVLIRQTYSLQIFFQNAALCYKL